MQSVYFILTAVHIVAIVVTGMMWTIVILRPKSSLKRHQRDLRAVHFGSLYLVPTLLGLAYAFARLQVPWYHQLAYPAVLALLVTLSGIGYLFPRPKDLDPFHFWTRGWAKVISLIGLAFLVVGLLWTAGILVVYSLAEAN